MGSWLNTLFLGDSLDIATTLTECFKEKIRLIYIDPPFFTETDYSLRRKTRNRREMAPTLSETRTYSDKWEGGLDQYLVFLKERLSVMKPLLSNDGSLWLHLDWHVSHYARVILDQVFGNANFVNEIVWKRTNSPKAQSRGFGSQHDTILVYAKDSTRFSTLPVYRKHDSKSIQPYIYKDDRGKFRLIEIEAQGIQRSQGRKQFEWRERTAPYLYKAETLDKWWDEGLIYRSKNGRYSKKQYLDDVPGVVVSDLWLDIPPIQGNSLEYTGFLTQKPEGLLYRIIECSTMAGDIVADFFAGSGTTAVVAERMGRKWIIGDSSEAAVELAKSRLGKVGCKFQVIHTEAQMQHFFSTSA